MNNKNYVIVVVLAVLVLVALGAYNRRAPAVDQNPVQELSERFSQEIEPLDEEVVELDAIEEDEDLSVLEDDLTSLINMDGVDETAEEVSTEEVSDFESMELEMRSLLDGFDTDFVSLEGIDQDSSLNSLDAGLSSASQ